MKTASSSSSSALATDEQNANGQSSSTSAWRNASACSTRSAQILSENGRDRRGHSENTAGLWASIWDGTWARSGVLAQEAEALRCVELWHKASIEVPEI